MSLLDSLSRAPSPSAPWLDEKRARARAQLEQHGLPTARDEAFRFTSLQPIAATDFAPAPPLPVSSTVNDPHVDSDCHRIVIVDGRPKIDARALPQGVTAMTLEDAIVLGVGFGSALERTGLAVAPYGFVALNTALFDDAIVLRIAKGAVIDKPIELMFVSLGRATPTVSYPRVLVVAEPGSEATIVEHHVGTEGSPFLACSVTELVLEPGAHLEHVRVTEGVPRGHHVGAIAVHVGETSVFSSRIVTLGGSMARLDLHVLLDGEGAESTLEGTYLAGQGEHVDHHTRIEHAHPHGTSREVYRGVVQGDGVAVFDGTVIVRPGAQKTIAHQENRNLLLSRDGAVHTKPHLEIDADDVKCSHGATVGTLDDSQLFYLRSRGVDEGAARAMLVFAFVRELVEHVRIPSLRARVGAQLLARLPEGARVKELVT